MINLTIKPYNRIHFLLSLCLIVCLLACNRPDHHKRNKHLHAVAKAGNQAMISTSCAVFVNPTIHQIDSMKTKGDSIDFYTLADDNDYYLYLSGKYLDSLKVKKVNTESKGTMTFKASSGQLFKMRLDTLYWGVILFNGKSKPIVADMTDIEMDYKQYMQN